MFALLLVTYSGVALRMCSICVVSNGPASSQQCSCRATLFRVGLASLAHACVEWTFRKKRSSSLPPVNVAGT
eukprot:6193583-Pleurochrysis_carterae.AAC.3